LASLAQKLSADAGLEGSTLGQLLKRPEVTIEDFLPLLERAIPDALRASCPARPAGGAAWVRADLKAAETAVKYEGYLVQQQKQIERMKRAEARRIPEWFDYRRVSGLSREMVEKLSRVRPVTLGQASRIPGVTPAAINIIHVYLELGRQPSPA
jgi:tRNA uridine 5-carboxymethylaminomethyl modification enzyme